MMSRRGPWMMFWFTTIPSGNCLLAVLSNLLRRIRQDRIDLDAVAANMCGPAPPDKHKESARFMQPLLGEVVSTIKSHAPAPAASSSQSPESTELATATKRKLQEAGIALTPEKKPGAAQNSPSSTGPSLPTKGTKTPAEEAGRSTVGSSRLHQQ